jgi:hypothetical protein
MRCEVCSGSSGCQILHAVRIQQKRTWFVVDRFELLIVLAESAPPEPAGLPFRFPIGPRRILHTSVSLSDDSGGKERVSAERLDNSSCAPIHTLPLV